jgi:hypothetical protein
VVIAGTPGSQRSAGDPDPRRDAHEPRLYVAEFFASFKLGVTVGADGQESTNVGEKALGVVHVVVGAWLMYLTVATTLDITSGFHLPGA